MSRTSHSDKDEPRSVQLPAEDGPVSVHVRLAPAARDAAAEVEVSHAEQKRIEAELWHAEHGSGRVLKAFRGPMELEGYLASAWRKFTAAPTAEEAAHWRKTILSIHAEIRRRANGGCRIPLAMRQGLSTPRAKGKSPGRPRNASREITLRRRAA